ncbi:carbohydrate ABC transporter substrate-binding protein (CUT1 family) [Scopulibacillus darangshiensis]|uniref:Carbohydrate ABC transporter substrate-binding protein (CUT1 family) n=1 Tax=Scopulibacillus darangshiensis TaxID=442528 RepID=A0A4R2NRM7_9BACL|nr:ABC transporter substrate-binding protein [Scopulibacillus darangshiensis]TCP24084.1 carbohydrate ABC transporter substrate-binding protein (CUT1 family) [Scopulibacillus darangshiensis]
MKRTISIFASLLLVVVLGLSGCSNDQHSSGKANSGKTEIAFWHSISGDNGKALEKIVEAFNKQSKDVHVKPVYQGSYTDLLNKIQAAGGGGSNEMPAVMNTYGPATNYVANSDFITPMYQFIKKDNFDISKIVKNVSAHYEVNGKLYSMPFSASNAVMFYNKDMFKKAGLDPNDPPNTYSEIKKAAEKLTVKKDGKTMTYGFSMATIGWFFEELLANQNALYVNNENGRSGKPTKALVNEEPGLKAFKWLNDMNKEGVFKNYGRKYDAPRAAFYSGQLAMFVDSSANTRQNIKNAPFEVGAAYYPAADDAPPHGSTVGGNQNWITNKVSKKKQEAAWEFVKYLVKPEVQAEWDAATGYFPVTTDATHVDELKNVYQKYPQMKVAVDQLNDTKLGPATEGPLMDIYEESRGIIEDALEKMYQGTAPQKALDDAAKRIDQALKK